MQCLKCKKEMKGISNYFIIVNTISLFFECKTCKKTYRVNCNIEEVLEIKNNR